MMKNFKLYLLSFVLIAGFLTACSNNDTVVEEQNIDETEAITESLNRLAQQFNAEGDVIASANPSGNIVFDYCFDFVYPLDLSYNNGTTVSVNSLDDLITILINSTDDLYISGVAFPFDVETYDGSGAIIIVTINNENEFFDLLEDCDFETIDDCNCTYEYAPVCVEIEDPNGVSFIITYPNACAAQCDGFTPNDFIENCTEDGNNTGGFECFEFNFPLSIINDEQETITVNSQEELDNVLYNTYYFDFVYSFDVTLNNEILTIGNEEAFIALLDYCYNTNDCACPDNVDPVCVEIQTGSGNEIITFLNACEAECEGFTVADFVDCDNNPSGCSEQEVFAYLLQCNWYINTSLYNAVNPEYAQFFQDGSLEIFSEGSNQGVTGTWDLASNPTENEVFMFFNINSAPSDVFSQLDWTVTTCSDYFIVLESGDEFIQLERDCNTNGTDCTDEVPALLTDCSWSLGDYDYVFDSEGTVTITGGGVSFTGQWLIGSTSPTSIFIQVGTNNLDDEWIFQGCDDNETLEVFSTANPNGLIETDCN